MCDFFPIVEFNSKSNNRKYIANGISKNVHLFVSDLTLSVPFYQKLNSIPYFMHLFHITMNTFNYRNAMLFLLGNHAANYIK